MSSIPFFPLTVAFQDERIGQATHDAPPHLLSPENYVVFKLISATILTKNSANRLGEVLAALDWCDEVVILDTGSIDNTVEIARQYPNTRVHHLTGTFPGFGRAHQQAVALARNDWILSIDSDEIVSPALATEITSLELRPQTVYTFPFHNYFNARLIKSCGWHPDRHGRLFNRKLTDFCDSNVHEKVKTQGLTLQHLRHPVHHYSYESADDFLRKMRAYCQLFATQYAGTKSSSPGKALRHGIWAFFKSYFFQRGFLEGYAGLIISVYKAQTAFWKYLLLCEANGTAKQRA